MHRLVLDTPLLPDPERVERARRSPEHGPRILFFSGGTALREVSRALTRYTHRSIHLLTPFDSGGSSAQLRRAFAMPSVGDLRNRLLALADRDRPGVRSLTRVLAERLGDASAAELIAHLRRVCDSAPPALAAPLRTFLAAMPADFDLRGGCIGNLVLAGSYLAHDRDLEAALVEFAATLGALGAVHAVIDADVQLAADLADGSRVVGQHRMTGKEHTPLAVPITDLHLVDARARPVAPAIDANTHARIAGADLICLPIGSFFTSVLANLLPRGVGRAVQACGRRKVYVPNPGHDPEQLGTSLADRTALLLRALRRDAGETLAAPLLDTVLLDVDHHRYGDDAQLAAVVALGVRVLRMPLLDADGRVDPVKFSEALVSLA